MKLPAIAVLLALASPAHALTFDQALLAGAQLPAVQALQRAAALRARLDGDLPLQTGNPELNMAAGPSTPLPSTALQLSVVQTWNLADLGKLRRLAAQSERHVLGAELRLVLLEHRLAAAQAWLALWTAEKSLEVAEKELALAVALADSATRAVAKNVLSAGDAAEAKTFAVEAQLTVLHMDGERRHAVAQLARALGGDAAVLQTCEGPLPRPTLPAPNDWRISRGDVQALPQVALHRLQAAADQARALETAAQHGSELSVGGALQRDPQGSIAALAVVNVRWALFERGQRARAQALEQAERQQGQAETAALVVQVDLELARHEVEHTQRCEQALVDQLMPALQAQVAARELAMKRGVGLLPDVLRARRMRTEAERRMIQAQSERAWAEVKAWLLLAAQQAGEP